MAPKNSKTPKYYIAAQSINDSLAKGDPFIKMTEKEAIDAARTLVERDNNDRYVVKILRRVRRQPRPVVVEVVK